MGRRVFESQPGLSSHLDSVIVTFFFLPVCRSQLVEELRDAQQQAGGPDDDDASVAMLAEKLQKRGGGREWLLNQMEAEKAGEPAPQSAGGANHVQSASGVGQAHVRINVPPAAVNPIVQGAPPPPPSDLDMDDKAVERALRVKRAMADLKLDDMLEMEKMDQQVGALGDLQWWMEAEAYEKPDVL
jgi:hypothetical protein